METLFNPTVIAEWCALIAAICLLNKKTGRWRLFFPLLALTIITETMGWLWTYILHNQGNGWIFNINLLITSVFYIWLLFHAAPLQRIKNLLRPIIVIFLLFSLVNGFLKQGFISYQTYTDVFAEFLLIVTDFYFFYQILREDNYRNLFLYEYFWLVNGLLLYALGGVVLYAFYDVITSYDKLHGAHLYGFLNYIINILFYGSLIIAFICRNRTKILS